MKAALFIIILAFGAGVWWVHSDRADQIRRDLARSWNGREDAPAYFASSGSTLIVMLSEPAGYAETDSTADQIAFAGLTEELGRAGFERVEVTGMRGEAAATRSIGRESALAKTLAKFLRGSGFSEPRILRKAG